MANDDFDLESFLKEGHAAMDEFPYDAAAWHCQGDEYPSDLPPSAARTHMGMYIGWAIERGLASDALKNNCAEIILQFLARQKSPSEIVHLCCNDELKQSDLNDAGNAFTQKYYRPGWKYSYDEDYAILSGNDKSPFYMQDSWENYEKVRSIIEKRYTAYLKQAK